MSRTLRLSFQYLLGENNKSVTAQTLAYVVAPRINAGGRMGDANMALKRDINYMFLPGIPGKYSPSSAADIILTTIENIIAESGKDANQWIYGEKG